MVHKTNSFERFWLELKRRKVFGVVTTYAATAYIIIEVINNLAFPLNLPVWIATLVLIILVIGLPVVIVLSWIFDFTPKGIEKTVSLEESDSKEIVTKPVKGKLRASYVLNGVLIIVVLILAYPKIFKRDTLERLRSSGERISVAVMPFQNQTHDTIWNLWMGGIQTNLIYSLSNYPEALKVSEIESTNNLIQSKGFTNYVSITPSVASSISQKLDANVFIYGRINTAGTLIRINVQLINSKTKEIFKSFQIEGPSKEDSIFKIIDSISILVTNFLRISVMEKNISPDLKPYKTSSPEAYRNFILAEKAFIRNDIKTSLDLYSKAVAIDSNFIPAIIFLSMRYGNLGYNEDAKRWCLKAYKKRDQLPLKDRFMAEWYHASLFETLNEEIKYLKQYQDIDDQVPISYYITGTAYSEIMQYSKAIPDLEKALEIYKKWGIKPIEMGVLYYTSLGYAYHKTNQYKKERKLYKKAEQDFPDDPDLIYRQAILALSEGNTKNANEYIDKYKFMLKQNSSSEADIMMSMGYLYLEAEILDKAEEYLRKALSLEPESPGRMNRLASFLIDNDRNINEGQELVDTALKSNPDNYSYLHTKGWGLYKQGKYKEALEILQKSWVLRREKAVYDHYAFLHLEAAKKAVAILKAD